MSARRRRHGPLVRRRPDRPRRRQSAIAGPVARPVVGRGERQPRRRSGRNRLAVDRGVPVRGPGSPRKQRSVLFGTVRPGVAVVSDGHGTAGVAERGPVVGLRHAHVR